MFAAKAGFERIYSCEVSDVMCDLQKEILLVNEVSNTRLINKMSTLLEIPKDIDDRLVNFFMTYMIYLLLSRSSIKG